jgi:hypothetical protein
LSETLLRELPGLTLVMVSHDLAVITRMCERLIVMKDGKIVGAGRTADIMRSPQKAYTAELIDAAEAVTLAGGTTLIPGSFLESNVPSPSIAGAIGGSLRLAPAPRPATRATNWRSGARDGALCARAEGAFGLPAGTSRMVVTEQSFEYLVGMLVAARCPHILDIRRKAHANRTRDLTDGTESGVIRLDD